MLLTEDSGLAELTYEKEKKKKKKFHAIWDKILAFLVMCHFNGHHHAECV